MYRFVKQHSQLEENNNPSVLNTQNSPIGDSMSITSNQSINCVVYFEHFTRYMCNCVNT